MTRILLVEDHPVAAAGLEILIQNDPELSKRVQLEHWKPDQREAVPDTDVIFLSLNYKSDLHKYFSSQIKNGPGEGQRLILFCDESQLTTGLKFLYLGAAGLVSQEADEEEITRCLRRVVDGKAYVCQHSIRKILDIFVANILAGEGNPLNFILSSPEHDVIQLLLKGKSLKEIAGEINVKPSRVSHLKAGAFQKLGVRNLFELSSRVRSVFDSNT